MEANSDDSALLQQLVKQHGLRLTQEGIEQCVQEGATKTVDSIYQQAINVRTTFLGSALSHMSV